ncbi:MAG: hypothetical protein WBF53_00850 [Litorimonas sp.]
MLIRTVLDCRPSLGKFYCSLLLLAASWADRVRPHHGLEVVITGTPPRPLLAFLEAVGAHWRIAEPDPGLAFVPTGNTLLGGMPSETGERILLVDNDLYLMGDLNDLAAVDPDVVAGVPSGHPRVTAEQWRIIESDLGLPTHRNGWDARGVELANRLNGRDRPTRFARTYINGGVLLLPRDGAFVDRWRAHIVAIADRFRGTAMDTRAVCGSNMAGLATAVGAHERFQWLGEEYNYRHLHVLLDILPVETVSILHLTGDPRQDEAIDPSRYVSQYVELYWTNRVIRRLENHPDRFGATAAARVRETVAQLSESMLGTVRTHDLDGVMEAVAAGSPSL